MSRSPRRPSRSIASLAALALMLTGLVATAPIASADGIVDEFVITADPTGPVTAGATVDFTIEAWDSDSEIVDTSYEGPANASLSDPHVDEVVGTPITFANGVAELSIDLLRAGARTLEVEDGSLFGDIEVTVDPGAADAIEFLAGPGNETAGEPFGVEVQVTDEFGNLVSDGTGVDIDLLDGEGAPTLVTLAGTTSQSTSSGDATFSGLSIETAGAYQLRATSGTAEESSTVFDVGAAAPSQLSFGDQPQDTYVTKTMSPVTVEILDDFGNLTDSSADVDIQVTGGEPTVDGTTPVAAVSGIATFGDLVIDEDGTFTLTATSGELAEAESAEFNVLPWADLQVSVGSTPVGDLGPGAETVVAGEQVSIDVDVENLGPSGNESYELVVEVGDPLITFDGYGAPDGVTCDGEGQSVTCEGGPLSNGESAIDGYSIIFDVAASFPDGGNFEATASLGETIDPTQLDDAGENSASSQVDVARIGDLGVEVTADENAVAGLGHDVTVTVTNEGPSNNGAYSVEIPVPADTSFASGDCAAAEGTITCSSGEGDLAPGGSDVFEFTLDIDPGFADPNNSKQLDVTATLASSDPTDQGPDEAPNTDTATTTVVRKADLEIAIVGDVDPIAGTDQTYTVTVTNHGPSNNGGYVVDVDVPAGTTFESADDGCTDEGTVVTCTSSAILAVDDAVSYDVTLHIASSYAGSDNQEDLTVGAALVSANPTDQGANTEADSDESTLTVLAEADLELVSHVATTPTLPSASTVYANSNAAQNTVTYTIVVENDGPSDAQAVELSVDLATEFIDAKYCTSASCTPAVALTDPIELGAIVSGGSMTVKVSAKADPDLRDGPITDLTASAEVSSTTDDPGPAVNSRTSNAVQIFTVADPPATVTAIAGNGNAVVYWPPVAPADNGGTPLTGYTLTVVPLDGGDAPGPISVPTTTTNTQALGTIVQWQVGAEADTTLTNGKLYEFTVQSVNAVGSGDATTSNEITPSADLSAKILDGNDSQRTGNTLTTTESDPIFSVQQGNFKTGTIGTLEEIFGTGGSGPSLQSIDSYVAEFCGGLPCTGDKILVNKLTDPTTGRYQIDLHYHKSLITGTGKKDVYFDPTPGESPEDIALLANCPKRIPADLDACIVKLTGPAAKNPDLRILISIRRGLIDPATALRR